MRLAQNLRVDLLDAAPQAADPAPVLRPDGTDFTAFFTAHRAWVHRYLLRLTRNADEADDLLQDTFVLAWRKSSQFRGEGSPSGWVRRIAFRCFLNARVRRGRALRGREDVDPAECAAPAGDDDGGGDLVDRIRQRTALARTIEALPTVYRELLVLRCRGMTVTEIARVLKLTCKAAELRIARGLRFAARGVTTPAAAGSAAWWDARRRSPAPRASSGTRSPRSPAR
jgi:RNA polymerase sigma-70 factor, ECF subfamily